ncbi:RNA polymerase sigma factor [Amycolatopsis nivea]
MGVDQESFTRLYDELYPRVVAYALRRAGDEDAYDAVDEAFLIAWRKRAELPDAVLPWLLVTVRNTLANQRRRRQHQDVVAAEVARELSQSSERPDAAVVERVRVLSALSELSERERDALMLTVWEGLTAQQAARVAGCSVAAFAMRLLRARRRFTDALARWDARSLDDSPAFATAVTHTENRQMTAGKDAG